MVKVSAAGTNPTGGGGSVITKTGDYHFSVEEYVEAPRDGVLFEMKVKALAGTDPEQVGRTAKLTYWNPAESQYDGKSEANKLFHLASALGPRFYSYQRWQADTEAGVEPDLPFENSEGMQFCGHMEVTEQPPNPEGIVYHRHKLKQTWAVGDSGAANVPKDSAALRALGDPLPVSGYDLLKKSGGKSGGNGASKPAPRPAPKAATVTPDDTDADPLW